MGRNAWADCSYRHLLSAIVTIHREGLFAPDPRVFPDRDVSVLRLGHTSDWFGQLERHELQAALLLYMKSVAKVIPTVVAHQFKGMGKLVDSDQVRDEIVTVVDEVRKPDEMYWKRLEVPDESA